MPCPATAMKIQTIINCMLLVASVWTRLHVFVAGDRIAGAIWAVCGNSEYRNGSALQRNITQVLDSLVGNVSTSGFNTTSVKGRNSMSTVYGLVQCRGDLNSSDCKASASTAKRSLLERCPNTTSGIVYEDNCFLRYDNHKFYTDHNESSQFMKVCNPFISDQPEQFGKFTEEVLSKIIEKAVHSPKHFATDKFETASANMREIYSLAQCWGDLSETSCQSCLAAGQSNISGRLNITSAGCPTGALGARYLSSNCLLRYDIYSFFNTSIIPSPHKLHPEQSPPSPAKPQPEQSPPSPAKPQPEQSPPLSGGQKYKVFVITQGVLAATIGLIAVICLLKWNLFCRRKPSERVCRRKPWEHVSQTRGEGGEINISLSIAKPELIFDYDILRDAASNFIEENKLGEGGFGSVFKGVLPDAREVAIKRLNIGSRQGDIEFLNEANLISCVQHSNLVKLLGCCVESSERLLVYEYLQNSSLDKILFDTTKRHLLDWRARHEIIVGTARGLAFLHEESEIRIIHRDIKASNILLDHKHKPKIADFGLAKLFAEDQSHVSTRVAGTFGYMAPEYALRGQLTEKADVFSYGVLVLEIISGRKNQSLPQHMEFLVEATWRLYNEERALEVMDRTLEGSYSSEEAIRVIKIGLLCIQAAAALRPSMSRVVSMLTSEQEHISSPARPVFIDIDSLATPHQRLKVIDPDKTASSSTATSSTTRPFDIHSPTVNPSSSTLQPR